MHIYINDQPEELPGKRISVSELLKAKEIPSAGTAVAVNDRLVPKSQQLTHMINEGDRIILISATYGG